MIPEVELLSSTNFNWPSFRATIDKALNLRPDSVLNSLPVDFSDDATILLNMAAYYSMDIKNSLEVLRDLPQYLMGHLSYSFMIACNESDWDKLRTSQITQVLRETESCSIIIASGSLEQWYVTIVLNLMNSRGYSTEAIIILDKIMLILERKRGLGIIFEKFKKKMQANQTFLLERK